jgi:hypothetical protein
MYFLKIRFNFSSFCFSKIIPKIMNFKFSTRNYKKNLRGVVVKDV